MKRLFLTAGLTAALCGVASLIDVPGVVAGTSSDVSGSQSISVKSNREMISKAPRAVGYNDTITITPDENSGIYGANYTYTDPITGEVYGFHSDEDGRDCKIVGAKTYRSDIWFPKVARVVSPSNTDGVFADIWWAEFTHDLVNEGLKTSFPEFTDEEFDSIKKEYPIAIDEKKVALQEIYLPSTITNVSWFGKFDTKAHNFYLNSQQPPNLRLEDGANGKIVLFVDKKLLPTYRDYVKNKYSNYTIVVRSNEPLSPTNVNVEEPGTLATELSKIAPNLQDVTWVIVTGKPNSEDLRFFRRLPNLEILDLSQTTGLTEISGCNGLEYLREVILPETGSITEIGNNAFDNCKSLQSINIPEGITKIGDASFRSTLLDSIHLSNSVREIGRDAFSDSKLRKINLDLVKIIGNSAFYEDIDLKEVEFGDSLTEIDNNAFAGCDIRRLKFPNGNLCFGMNIFGRNKNLQYIEFSSNNSITLYNDSFSGTYPDTIVVKYLFPLESSGFGENDLRNAKVFVPALTHNDFLLSDAWAACPNILPLEEDLNELTIDRYFNLRSETGLAEKADIKLTSRTVDRKMVYGQLSVKRKTDLNAGKFEINGRSDFRENWTSSGYVTKLYYNGATFLPNSKVSADELNLHLTLVTDRWHFLSFPFDVKVKDIEVEEDALWVVRHYSGENRANMNGETWQNLQEDDVLKAGEGYIFHCAKDGDNDVDFTFRRAEGGDDKFFEFNKISTPLKSYPSEFAHNAHWNLVGNSYPAFLNLKSIDFDAPITVWDGNTYTAYSPIDDELALNPFQAFFVQLQETEGGDTLLLNAWGRAHSEEEALATEAPEEEDAAQSASKARAARKAEPRSLFNLSISNGINSDRTRLVVNELASLNYESNRDASKFMSSSADAPQIFIINNGQRMAIDERPFGQGVYNIGIYAPKKGEYSLSLAGAGLEGFSAYIFDSLTNTTTELGDVDYIFSANGGIDEGRFQLILRPGIETGVEEIASDGIVISTDGDTLNITAPAEVEISVVAADGKLVATGKAATFSAILSEGIYVVKAGEAVKKVIIR